MVFIKKGASGIMNRGFVRHQTCCNNSKQNLFFQGNDSYHGRHSRRFSVISGILNGDWYDVPAGTGEWDNAGRALSLYRKNFENCDARDGILDKKCDAQTVDFC